MEPILTSTLASAGVKLVGGVLGNIFDKPKQLPDIPVYTNTLKYGATLRDVLKEREREGLDVAQRESVRSGTALGGAYLTNVNQIQKQINDIYGRQVSSFEMQQMMTQSQWGMEQAKVAYGESARQSANWQGTIGDVFGSLAAIPTKMYQRNRQQDILGQMKTMIPETPETNQGNPTMDLFNNVLMLNSLQSLKGTTIDSKIWDSVMGSTANDLVYKMMGMSDYQPKPEISPLR